MKIFVYSLVQLEPPEQSFYFPTPVQTWSCPRQSPTVATANAAGVGGVFSQSTKLLHLTTKPAKTQSWQDKNAAALARGTIPRPLLALQATHNIPTIFFINK